MHRRLAIARVARLGTLDRHDRVHIVPVCFALEERTVVTAIDAKPKSTMRLQRLRNLDAHPYATLLVDHYDEDWSQLWWIRVRGPVTVHTGDARQWAVDLLARKYPQYRAEPPEGPVIALDVEHWSGWKATNS